VKKAAHNPKQTKDKSGESVRFWNNRVTPASMPQTAARARKRKARKLPVLEGFMGGDIL
jgi:hypothetical protein